MNRRAVWNRATQWLVVLLTGFALKRFYATASADQLRWILTPTTALVELVNGGAFAFEAGAGYLSRERNFLIAASCAGVNFLLTAFLLLTLSKLVRERSRRIAWGFIPVAALLAYLTTILANVVRITVALKLGQLSEVGLGLNAAQVHRLEGIVIYFGFLLLLFWGSEKVSLVKNANPLYQTLFPLLVYYAVMLGIPLAKPVAWQSANFREHLAFVLLVPLVLVLLLIAFRLAQRKMFSVRAFGAPLPGA